VLRCSTLSVFAAARPAAPPSRPAGRRAAAQFVIRLHCTVHMKRYFVIRCWLVGCVGSTRARLCREVAACELSFKWGSQPATQPVSELSESLWSGAAGSWRCRPTATTTSSHCDVTWSYGAAQHVLLHDKTTYKTILNIKVMSTFIDDEPKQRNNNLCGRVCVCVCVCGTDKICPSPTQPCKWWLQQPGTQSFLTLIIRWTLVSILHTHRLLDIDVPVKHTSCAAPKFFSGSVWGFDLKFRSPVTRQIAASIWLKGQAGRQAPSRDTTSAVGLQAPCADGT